jgi:hypothetical protein
MADAKISQLPLATTPLAGTEVLPVVQGGTTDQVTVANLTAGREVGMAAASSGAYKVASAAIITESGATRALSAGDNGKIIYCTSGSAVTITTASGLGAGFSCVIIQGGNGQVSVLQGSSTTLVSYGSFLKTAGQYAAVTLICPVADTFILTGQTA